MLHDSIFLLNLSRKIFRWQLDPLINCTIEETGQTCDEYIASLPDLPADRNPQLCKVNLLFGYTVTNTGSGDCEEITSLIASINDGFQATIPLADSQFCPEDTKTLIDRRELHDICEMAGLDNGVKLVINDLPGTPGQSFLPFNSFAPTMAPIVG